MKVCLFICMFFFKSQIIFAKNILPNHLPPAEIFNADIKPLTIGDKVPDIEFGNVLNYKNRSARLSDFRGKLVVLDFWSTSCSACIGGFPKMEALQKAFGDKIQVLLVNPHTYSFDSEEKIKALLKRLKTRTGYSPSLPIPISDSILNDYFPHQSIPHQVWIDGSGKVAAITGPNEVTSENIQAVLDGKAKGIPEKNDWAFDPGKPLFEDGNLGDPGFVYRSVFTKYIGKVYNMNSGVRRNEGKDVIGMFLINFTLRDFVNDAYGDILGKFSSNRIFWDVKDNKKFSKDFVADNAYCYDLTLPPVKSSKFRGADYLQDALRHTFNIKVGVQQKVMRCAIIRYMDSSAQTVTKYQEPDIDLEQNSLKKFIHGYPVKEMVDFLDQFDVPLINEVNSKRLIDIDLPENFNFSDFKAFKIFMEKQGFSITEEQRKVDVAVISDK